jgi:uncharacterized protein (DUF433 family)
MATTVPLGPRAVPLTELDHGVLRVTGTRIPLERVVEGYKAGATPEQIVQAFDSLRLADVYTLIGYYLDHTDQVEQYLREQDELADEVRRNIEALQGPSALTREVLLERKRRMEEAKRNAEARH